MKYSVILNCEFNRRASTQSNEETIYIQLRSKMRELNGQNIIYLDYELEKNLQELDQRIDQLALSGSGWNLSRILEITIEAIEVRKVCIE